MLDRGTQGYFATYRVTHHVGGRDLEIANEFGDIIAQSFVAERTINVSSAPVRLQVHGDDFVASGEFGQNSIEHIA